MDQQDERMREVVEVYRQPRVRTQPRERVLTYRRPLPERGKVKASVVFRPLPPPRQETEREKRRKKRRGLRRFLLCLLAVTALAGLSFALEERSNLPLPIKPPVPRTFEDDYDDRTGEEITISTFPTGQGGSLSVLWDHGETLTPQEIYRSVNPAVVLVMAGLSDGTSIGTGVIFTADGYVVTNYHVLEGGEDCQVVLDTGESCEALYVAGDAANDLAILKIDGTDLPTAEFGDSDLLTVGDKVYAIGNPLGVELRGTLTDGIVSAIDRDVWVDNRTMTLIQTNAALNSGNSGGPLINQYGQVVGINVIKMTSRFSNIEGLGFAIPSASMERIVNDLLRWGELQPEPVLGVTVQPQENPVGLAVTDVTPDSAAGRAGVQAGDCILRANGQPLRVNQDLLRIRRRCYVGDEMTLVLWRDGAELEVTLELEEPLIPEPEEAPWYAE